MFRFVFCFFSILSSTLLFSQTNIATISMSRDLDKLDKISNKENNNSTELNKKLLKETSNIIEEKQVVTYKDHLEEAISFNIPLIKDNEMMDSLILKNKLISVPENGDGYKIQKLTHSRAYLNEFAYEILKQISQSFYEETNKELSISSLTRTSSNQNKLSKINSNATKGHSAHSFGAAFDISYSRYGDVVGRNYASEKVLENILNKLVEEKRIYFIKERKQPCFHVTVRNIGELKKIKLN